MSLPSALGMVLAEDVVSGWNAPPPHNAAMNGYAVRSRDVSGASAERPIELGVVGRVPAGGRFAGQLNPGTAVRIMTGAPIQNGADTVIPFEDTDEAARERDCGIIGIRRAATAGAHVRRAGEDVAQDDVLDYRAAG